MRVFVFCPTRPEWPHIFGRSLMSIFRMRWEEPLDYHFMRGDVPLKEPFDRVTWKYQQGREIFLRGDYDAMLTIEADTIVPVDTLERIAAVKADVVYGVYVLRTGAPRWNTFTEVGEQTGKSLSEDPALARKMWGKVIPIAGVGMGCTFIYRRVLEELGFHRDGTSCNDWYFSLDCQKHGFEQKADLGVVCGHIMAKPSPRILWPDPNAERLYAIEYLGGEWVKVEAGERLEVIIDRMGEEPIAVSKGKR